MLIRKLIGIHFHCPKSSRSLSLNSRPSCIQILSFRSRRLPADFHIPPSCQGMEKLIEWSGKRLDTQLLSPEAVVKEYRDLLKDPGEMYKK